MEDRDFFDLLYQRWAKTTGAENTYWMPEESNLINGKFWIYAVGQDESRTPVANALKEADADFITALHGCFGDLVKRLHAALDEAERLDEERDEREATIAGLAIEIQDLERELGR